MKKILSSIVLLMLISQLAFSQGFVSEDNTWNVMATGFPGFLGTESYKIEGDSSLNGHDYKMIWLTMDSVDAAWSYKGLLREDANIVYFIQEGKDTESVLYDFNALPGDTVWIINMFCWEDVQAVVIGIDTVEYYGVERRRWELYSEWGYPEYWIEGIGSNLGPLHSLYSLCIVCPTWDLLCFHTAGQQFYQMPGTDRCYMTNVGLTEEELAESVQIFPNPVIEKFELRSGEFELKKVDICDLSGKKLISREYSGREKAVELDVGSLNAGMYICRIFLNGRQLTRKIIIE